MPNHSAAEALALHQRESLGMTSGSPDRCRCGVKTMPAPGDDEITVRRDRAFAEHQADVLAAIERGDIPGVGVLPESETLTEEEGADLVEAATVWALSASGAQSLDRWDALVAAVERILAGRRARPASVDAETLRQVADELADWIFPDPDETRPHSAYRVALLERLHRYVGLLRSRADLAADREPDGLRAKVEALAERWSSEGITCECGHYVGHDHNSRGCYAVVTYSPLVRCSCVLTDDRNVDDLAAAQLRALLAHPATDQEEADRG